MLSLPARLLSEDLQAQCTNANTPSAQPQQQYQLQTLVLHHGKKATGGHYSAFTREYIPGAPAAGTSAGLVAGPVGANHPSSGSTGAGAGAGAKHSKPPLANKITAPVQAPVVKGDSSDTQHDLRGRSVWRSINDAKISVITEAQALSAQDTVSVLILLPLLLLIAMTSGLMSVVGNMILSAYVGVHSFLRTHTVKQQRIERQINSGHVTGSSHT